VQVVARAPQGAGEDNTLDLNGLINVVSTVTVTDGDEDVVSAQSASSGLSLTFNDTDPTLSITSAPTVGAAVVIEASAAGGQGQATITPPTFTSSAVDGFTTTVSHALALAGKVIFIMTVVMSAGAILSWVERKQSAILRWWLLDKLADLGVAICCLRFRELGFLLAELWGGIVGMAGEYDRSLKRVQKIREQAS